MDARYTAVFERHGDWWIGYTEELPGANAQERTLEEARESLREAVQLILEVNREIALELFFEVASSGEVAERLHEHATSRRSSDERT